MLLREKHRKLVLHHLGQFLDQLFADFTGVRFHTVWTPALPQSRDGQIPPFAYSVCRRLIHAGPQQCADCALGPKHLATALHLSAGHRFICRPGDPQLLGSHPVLERVVQNGHQPMTLRQCAVELKMNAAYLSALFSRAVGLPFKTYITELRLAKAKELLSEADKNVKDVAYAVGYASGNQFRIAFKKATGLAPQAMARDDAVETAGAVAIVSARVGSLTPPAASSVIPYP